MVKDSVLVCVFFVELALVSVSPIVGRYKLGTTFRALAWASAIWIVAGIIEVQSRLAHIDQWSSIPIFYGVDSSMIAMAACTLIAAGIVERAFLYIDTFQNGEMPLLGTAFALVTVTWERSACTSASILTFLALSTAVSMAIRHAIVSSPARLPEPGSAESEPPDDIGPNGSYIAFITSDRVLQALVAAYVSIFLVYVVSPQLMPYVESLQALVR